MFDLELIQVIPTKEYQVYLYYSDGTVRKYDACPIIQKGGIFEKLQDIDVFLNTCTIMNDTLAWDIGGGFDELNCIDICPDTLLNAPIVKDVDALEKKLFA